MSVQNPKELFVMLLSHARHREERHPHTQQRRQPSGSGM